MVIHKREKYRWRMQSLKTGWGVEAPGTPEGKKELLKMRKKDRTKFRWCRIYLVEQLVPSVIKYYEPFRLTHKKPFKLFALTLILVCSIL